MYKYAQINSNGVCFAVSQLSGEVIADDMIRIEDGEDTQYLGKIYVNGEWHEAPQESEGADGR